MVNEISTDLQVVKEADAAKTLLNRQQARYLTPFMHSPLTVSEAAEVFGDSLNSMYVRITRFVNKGLLVQDSLRSVGGRKLKTYRATGRRYFVPYEVMSFDSLETLHRHLDRPLEESFRRNLVRSRLEHTRGYGYEVYLNAAGQVDYRPAAMPGVLLVRNDPNTAAELNLWMAELHLDYAHAKEFQQALLELYRRYQGSSGGQRYLARLALVPMTEVSV